LLEAPGAVAVIVTVLPEALAVTGEPEAFKALARAEAMVEVVLLLA
jgi:hypothetical protein